MPAATQRGAQYSTDSYEVTLARYNQAAQLFSAHDTLLKRIFAMADKPMSFTPELMEALDKGLAREVLTRAYCLSGWFGTCRAQTLIDKTFAWKTILPKSIWRGF